MEAYHLPQRLVEAGETQDQIGGVGPSRQEAQTLGLILGVVCPGCIGSVGLQHSAPQKGTALPSLHFSGSLNWDLNGAWGPSLLHSSSDSSLNIPGQNVVLDPFLFLILGRSVSTQVIQNVSWPPCNPVYNLGKWSRTSKAQKSSYSLSSNFRDFQCP